MTRWSYFQRQEFRPSSAAVRIILPLGAHPRASQLTSSVTPRCSAWPSHSGRRNSGGPIEQSNLYNRHFRSIIERAEITTPCSLYTLRHTFATLALAAGIDAKEVSMTLGHASVAFTMDTYYHLIPAMQEKALGQIEQLFFGKAAAGR